MEMYETPKMEIIELESGNVILTSCEIQTPED